MRFPRHMYKDMRLLSSRFRTIQEQAHSLNANKKLAVDKHLPYFDDKTDMNKCHIFEKCHVKLFLIFLCFDVLLLEQYLLEDSRNG